MMALAGIAAIFYMLFVTGGFVVAIAIAICYIVYAVVDFRPWPVKCKACALRVDKKKFRSEEVSSEACQFWTFRREPEHQAWPAIWALEKAGVDVSEYDMLELERGGKSPRRSRVELNKMGCGRSKEAKIPPPPKVVYAGPYIGQWIRVAFDNGESGVCEVFSLLDEDAIRKLRDPAVFKAVKEEGGAAVWPGGISIAPETLYANYTP